MGWRQQSARPVRLAKLGRPEVERILDVFRSGGSAEDLRADLDHWSRSARNWGFAGPNGAMFLNQLVNDSDAHENRRPPPTGS